MTLSAEDLGLIREESLRVLQVELERRRPLSAAKKWLLGGGFVTAVTGVLGLLHWVDGLVVKAVADYRARALEVDPLIASRRRQADDAGKAIFAHRDDASGSARECSLRASEATQLLNEARTQLNHFRSTLSDYHATAEKLAAEEGALLKEL